MHDGVALIDAEGRIRLGNHGMASLLGAPLPPPPGTPFREFARAPELDNLLDRARSAGHSVELDLRLWSPRPRLVHDLLSLAELERPGLLLHVEIFDLRELVTQQALSFRPRAERAGLRLAVESGPLLLLKADRARLEQVVANLLDNAIKYTERGG